METTLVINSTSQYGEKQYKTISNINPEATTAQLSEFAQKVNALSTNTYSGASLVDKYDVETEIRPSGSSGGGSVKEKPAIIWDASGKTASTRSAFTINWTVESDAANVTVTWYTNPYYSDDTTVTKPLIGSIQGRTPDVPEGGTVCITIQSAATDNYEAGEWTYSFDYVEN